MNVGFMEITVLKTGRNKADSTIFEGRPIVAKRGILLAMPLTDRAVWQAGGNRASFPKKKGKKGNKDLRSLKLAAWNDVYLNEATKRVFLPFNRPNWRNRIIRSETLLGK